VQEPNQKLVFAFISRTMVLARPVATYDNVPPERVAALRHAFDATMKDADFLAEAKQQDLDIGPRAGAELQKTEADIVDTQPAVLDQIRMAIQSGSTSEERKNPAR
jgi:tripartite-type tricarboxylate transporter receptor subunit TctC